jgi:hypothetical protein
MRSGVRVLRSASTSGDASLGLPFYSMVPEKRPRKRVVVIAITGTGAERRGAYLALST